MLTVYFKNIMERRKTLCGQNTEYCNPKLDSTCVYRCGLKGFLYPSLIEKSQMKSVYVKNYL